jgi:replication-associated recombination protein RarA
VVEFADHSVGEITAMHRTGKYGGGRGGGMGRGAGTNGQVPFGQCFQWANEGRCRFGGNCKYKHGSAGGTGGVSNATGVGGRANSGSGVKGVCYEWVNSGTCKKGRQCNFLHDIVGGGGNGGGNRNAGRGGAAAAASAAIPANSTRTLERFISMMSAKGTTSSQVSKQIQNSPDLWRRVWDQFPSFGHTQLLEMVQAVAKIPSSSSLSPPPIRSCEQLFDLLLKKSKGKGNDLELLNTVEIGHNAVLRLLQFEWEDDKESVREAIVSIIVALGECLNRRKSKEHREVSKKLMDLEEEVFEKPWKIKKKELELTEEAVDDVEGSSEKLHKWRDATVHWLSSPSFFEPCSLPSMKVPHGSGDGVYNSLQDYTDIVHKLWMAMTFYDGFAALSPQCRCRKGREGQVCQQALWPLKSEEGSDVRCRTRGCTNVPKYSCRTKGHDSLCELCDRKARVEIRGTPGHRASTNVYDGVVSKIDNEGRLFVSSFKCRNPPKHPIHWNSTRRLSAPNMVGVIKTRASGTPLQLQDKITWGELGLHGQPHFEARKREEGCLMVNLLSIMEANLDDFAPGDGVAIIDCMTFVPEWIPVLKAIEQQLDDCFAPFDREGTYLNLCRSKPADTSNSIIKVTPLDDIKPDKFRELVVYMVDRSTLDPIQQIRRDANLKSLLQDKLYDLVLGTTLDKMQLVSFIDSLLNPVHLTMGPPGTGKSYLGVVLVRALIIIRDLWMKKNPSLKMPPILVLSYKNHAIDEFLCDLLASASCLRATNKLIRIGGHCSDPRLTRYSERSASKHDPAVMRCREDVESLHKLQQLIEDTAEGAAVFLAYKSEIFVENVSDEDIKKCNRAAYEATESLVKALRRIKGFQSILVAEPTNGTAENKELQKEAPGAPKISTRLFVQKVRREVAAERTEDKLDLTPRLTYGVSHYPETAFEDMLHLWLTGKRPLPQCCYRSEAGSRCAMLSHAPSPALCFKHCCLVEGCADVVVHDKSLCLAHACQAQGCPCRSIGLPHMYCKNHGCKKCVELGMPSKMAEDDPPRNVCSDHPMCISIACTKYTCGGELYCEDHKTRMCNAKTRRGDKCQKRAISRSQPYCRDHISQMAEEKEDVSPPKMMDGPSGPGDGSGDQSFACKATTKKGKPCKGQRLSNSSFCHDHTLLYPGPPLSAIPTDTPSVNKATETHHAKKNGNDEDRFGMGVQDSTKMELDTASLAREMENAEMKSDRSEGGIVQDDPGDEQFGCEDMSSSSTISEGAVNKADTGVQDNLDELDWEDGNENYQHIRDVFELAVDDEDDLSEHSFNTATDGQLQQAGERPLPTDAVAALLGDPAMWTWEMDLDERWAACQEIVSKQSSGLLNLQQLISLRFREARKELQKAKTRASIKVYEERSVIGGTMVGCVSRLDAIRSTRPFAILIEEASEVLEPLVFSCISESTMKLELIGDHRQLQPSVQNRFDFEIVNKVNISMFQRLIEAPETHKVPSTILSVQRRMRSSISDLTKEYYKDVIDIEDDVITEQRTIGNTGMREVPGLDTHLHLWTHRGDQKRAAVGVSRINPVEADMVCALACYIVACGVPKTSITILTPYKGQLKLIQKELTSGASFKAARLLSRDMNDTDVCRISTVDRYQGDENDVIIISLVVDKSSNTPFVKLLNRMIVLLSRARLAMYIVGNLGYFENNKGLSPHWARTLGVLRQGGVASLNAGDSEDVQRVSHVSDSLPMCCPCHTAKVIPARAASDLKTDFCQEVCNDVLACSHTCGIVCHWPQKSHNSLCVQLVSSPCSIHVGDLKCHQIYSNVVGGGGGFRRMPASEASKHYRCPVKVKVQLPCSHDIVLPCWTSTAITDGSQQLPECKKQSPIPFVFPDCKHEKQVNCRELKLFRENPGAVPACVQVHEYTPQCGHVKPLPCHKKTYYETSPARYICPEKETLLLPRCRHEVTVHCDQAKGIRHWGGISCTDEGVVLEGTDYGPIDYPCREKVTFVRKCGHENANVTCQQAFERARLGTSECHEKVSTVNRFCGHPCQMSCHDAQKLQEVPIPEPISKFDEGNARALPPSLQYKKCNLEVTVQRRCRHETKIKCFQMFGALPSCKETVPVCSPLCGHLVKVACCDEQSFSSWKPWSVSLHQRLNPFSLSAEKKLSQGIVPPPGAGLDSTSELPSSLKHTLGRCTQSVRITLPCNHVKEVPCAHLYHTLRNIDQEKCSTEVEVPLSCGHVLTGMTCSDRQQYESGCLELVCKEHKAEKCWNFDNCGKELLCPCPFKGVAACEGPSVWKCPSEHHEYDVNQCDNGVPQSCPGCNMDKLQKVIKASRNGKGLDVGLPRIFDTVSNGQILKFGHNLTGFIDGEQGILQNFEDLLNETPIWERPCATPRRVSVFVLLPKKRYAKPHDFKLAQLVNEKTMHGVPVHILNAKNLSVLKGRTAPNRFPVKLVVGVASLAHSTSRSIPKSKPLRKKLRLVLQNERFDSVLHNEKDVESIVVIDPDAVIFTHVVSLGDSDFANVADIEDPVTPQEAKRIEFLKPDEPFQCFQSYARDSVSQDGDVVSAELSCSYMHYLERSLVSGMVVDCSIMADDLNVEEIPDLLSKDLMSKMSFANRDAQPFAGKRLLDTLRKEHKWPILSLLHALELLEFDESSSKKHFEDYIKEVHLRIDKLHPWALLVAARLEMDDGVSRRLFTFFLEEFPEGRMFLSTEEQVIVEGSDADEDTDSFAVDTRNGPVSSPAIQKWESLKKEFPDETNSDATEKLLALTGLQKVKKAAVEIYQTALYMQALDADTRRKNTCATNFCLLGNPGTGKTTCCRLLAQILCDCKIRTTGKCIELTAQRAKDEGMDEFRKSAKSAMGGVLFIDEAYDLDPVGDLKGKPIVNELLTMCEDDRDKISVILAGYEDEFQKKLYAYNDGLRSRFQEIQFEDFDEVELSTIWNDMRKSREWEEEAGLCGVVVKRLMKSQGKKGFGNARDVRKQLENATKAAFARIGKNISKETMVISIVDAIGEDPRNNPKLRRILDKINKKIGWKRVKEAVAQLVELCGVNYQRELKGDPPHDIFLNRMMLGNPGTGKTSCASLYGELLKCLGFLSNGEVVMKSAGDFIGQHIGESQTKTIAILNSAKGKVLVIDEAYVLDDKWWGKQVLDTLVEKVQNSSSDDRAVMMLGYEEPMLKMIRSQNPGLGRRFPKDYALYFDDFSSQELLEILKTNLAAQKISASADFMQRALEVLVVQKNQGNFGNAGAVDTLTKGAVQKATARMKDSSGASRLEAEDITAPGMAKGDKDEDPLLVLDKLYRMDEVKKKLETLRNNFVVAQNEGRDCPSLGHFVFTGSPGTGKTTVARALAKILFGLGLISSSTCKETSGLDLTGDYVGQTVTKVNEILKDAKGGILFIDEAYTLGEGHFGKEACDAIVAGMTSDQFKDVVIIIAGYHDEIHCMLKRNAGLKSRFTHFMEFPDWTVEDCVKFFILQTKKEHFQLGEGVTVVLQNGFRELMGLSGWGNGRDVVKVWDSALSLRSDRVVNAPETLKTIGDGDISSAFDSIMKGRSANEQPISGDPWETPPFDSPMQADGGSAPKPPIGPGRSRMLAREQETEESNKNELDAEDSSGQSSVGSLISSEDLAAREQETEELEKNELDAEDSSDQSSVGSLGVAGDGTRDDGVSDYEWQELCDTKERERQRAEYMSRLTLKLKLEAEEAAKREEEARKARKLELERLERIKDEKQRLRELQLAQEREDKRRRAEEAERERREKEARKMMEERKKQEKIQKRLRSMGKCPAGFQWFQCGDGWKCGGGSHFVSDAQLRHQFGFDT